MKKLISYAVILSPVLLGVIFTTGFLAPWLMIRGWTAGVIWYLILACAFVGFFGSIGLAIAHRRLLWLIGTISTTLLFLLMMSFAGALAMSRMH